MLWVLFVILLIVIIASISKGNKKTNLEVEKLQKEVDEPTVSEVPTPNNSNSIADELIKLKALKDSGVLTDEEFITQKGKLLQ